MNNPAPCDRCDSTGGAKTYANQACLPLNGKVVCIDWCIHQLVAALNAGGVQTSACCCGHGRQPGRIDLADGRILRIENPPNCDLAICCDGREFHSPLDAALHLLWLLQRLSYSEPQREGMPADGPRFREGIREARKLLSTLGYEPRESPNTESLPTPATTSTNSKNER